MRWQKPRIFLLCFVNSLVLNSQNLVRDSSFEDVKIDRLNCSWTDPPNQFDVEMNEWSNPTEATPDILSLLVDTTCWSYAYPNTYNGFGLFCSIGEQMPHTGNVMAGILTMGEPEYHVYREYVHSKLLSPLETGRSYTVTFYASLAENVFAASNNLGVYFSVDEINSSTDRNLPYIPQLECADIITDYKSWIKIEGIVKALSPWEYITIGNFKDDYSTDTVSHFGNCDPPYYFIDDVSVVPSRVIVTGDEFICSGEAITLLGKYSPHYVWAKASTPNDIISTDSILTDYPTSNTTYVLYGTYDTAYFSVTVFPTPVMDYADTCNINWAEIELSVQDGSPPYSFQWNNGSTSPFQPRLNDGIHEATVTDANQCKDTASITTTCVEQGAIIKIPQAFTPNSDGINDYLPIFGDAGIIAKYQFSIFNRWGNLVYSTNDIDLISSGDINKGWNGAYKGIKQDIGVYTYYLNAEFVNGKKSSFTGNITLIR